MHRAESMSMQRCHVQAEDSRATPGVSSVRGSSVTDSFTYRHPFGAECCAHTRPFQRVWNRIY